jgi:hypothetical protein
MALIKDHLLTDNLTAAPFDRVARTTYAGQAHFGTGPATCRECKFWNHDDGYAAKRGTIKSARCRKYRALTGRDGAKVPADALNCRHFQRADKVLPRIAK